MDVAHHRYSHAEADYFKVCNIIKSLIPYMAKEMQSNHIRL